ncbi:uncharacterized protein LOC117321431 [Pecten maximus]|uniref:uncharacterized protein LOC117321431 n=1 Tax=Pecten maximus TaxID=6579 RepID=UPI00145908E3|nr:uncharacterized protein LOC117321431 [Pecten maximus]
MDERTRLCKIYFDLGLSYSHILAMLSHIHSIVLSMSTLKRTLRKARLYRRKNHVDILEVALLIEEKINSCGGQYWYRWMHLHCRHQGLNVPRDVVQNLMKIIDPIGVELRLSRRLRRRQYNGKGPDFLWHVDSYDKLKRYGLCVNGCIDGFSRCIMWLNVFTTSSDPKVISGYYIETVRSKGGFPCFIRGDRGTENANVAQMQEFLSERRSFIYGRSTANQRIEMFWNFLRKQCCQFWMDSLSCLVEEGLFDGYFLDRNLVQFCFLRLLQADLDEMAKTWNAHHIRPTKNQNCPHGRPLVMYSLPHMYNTTRYLQNLDERKADACAEECVFRGNANCDIQIDELCRIYMIEKDWQFPCNLLEGISLYRNLRNAFQNDLDLF